MGPLNGIRIIEIAGIGPAPYGTMMLTDLGAEVIRVDRSASGLDPATPPADILNRGRRSVALNLKEREGVETVLDLVESADVLIEGFRPGVMERLGLGPDVCAERNPRLVYARMTGWGQDGPYGPVAGHDLNYIALAGALGHIGRVGDKPLPPLNLVGDFGGGGMMMALGVCAALVERQASGQGQVIDVAMVDGAASLMSMMFSFQAMGIWNDERGTNMLDGGAHFYDTYECSDGEYVSIGSIEPQFYARLLDLLELDPSDLPPQHDRTQWPVLKARFEEIFRKKTRAQWCEILEGTDVCFAPVLTMKEATEHPHNVERGTFIEVAGITQPGPAPRFGRTPGQVRRPPPHGGQHTDEVLTELGYDDEKIAKLRASEAIF